MPANVIPAMLVIGSCAVLQASDSSVTDEQRQIDRWMDLYGQLATEYELTRTSVEGDVELMARPTPLSKYTNPVRLRQQHGAVFLWTHNGRPAAIGTFWSKLLPDPKQRRIATEFHSLSTDPIITRRDGEIVWSPGQPGVQFREIADANPAAESNKHRLIQLRQVAGQFSAEIVDDQTSHLRLLPQPLYQHSEDDPEVLVGGLFSFVMASDPELFLLIESRRDKSGDSQWRFAVARFTNAAVRLRRRGEIVWSCEPVTPTDRDGIYYYNPQVTVRDSVIH